jgi:nucleotide-binding universal stress UspA family protein
MADIDMAVSVQRGNPADVILAQANARSTAPDLIVLAAPSRRGIERLWWSSVAQAETPSVLRTT